jgi:hypothetical protein
MIEKNRAPIACGAVRVEFVARRNAARIPVMERRPGEPRGRGPGPGPPRPGGDDPPARAGRLRLPEARPTAGGAFALPGAGTAVHGRAIARRSRGSRSTRSSPPGRSTTRRRRGEAPPKIE